LPSLQEHARDSFENLLFSLCRFYELTGHYPANITAVSYILKQKRFEEVHRAAVRFPHEHFYFIGTPVPPAAKGAEAVRKQSRLPITKIKHRRLQGYPPPPQQLMMCFSSGTNDLLKECCKLLCHQACISSAMN
jgi:hypothetical protein